MSGVSVPSFCPSHGDFGLISPGRVRLQDNHPYQGDARVYLAVLLFGLGGRRDGETVTQRWAR